MIDYSRYPSPREYAKKRKQRTTIFFLATLFVIFLLATMLAYKKLTPSSSSRGLLMQAAPTPTAVPTPTPQPNSNGLQQTVQNALQGTQGLYGIAIKNLKTNEYYGLHADQSFASGSLYKLWVMNIIYKEIEQGKMNPHETLSKNAASLYKEFDLDVAPSDTSTTITTTVQDALYQMITISDNDTALLLTDKIGISSIQNFLEQNGFSESHVGIHGNQPVTSARDIEMFFEKLYKGELGNKDTTESMLSLLKQQRLNEKLPQYLPSSITLAHKTGEIDGYSHDAGIVFTPDADYVIVVLTQSDDPQSANSRIAQVSQNVYTYFTQNN